MTEWRILYATTVGNELLGELPYLTFSHTDRYLDVGSWSAEIPFDEADEQLVPLPGGGAVVVDRSGEVDYSGLAPWSTVVYFDRGGVILGCGVVVGIDLDYEAGTMQLSGPGIGAYYAKRLHSGSTWTNDEALDIARWLITDGDTGPSMDVAADTTLSGVLRDRTWFYNEVKPALEALDQLANVENGFDYRFRAHRESGAIVRRLHFDYPSSGRLTDIVFEVGVNAAVLRYSEDGSDMANVVRALGAGEGDDKLLRVASAVPPGNQPELHTSISHIDVKDAATLDEHAQRRLQRGLHPTRRITLTLVPDSVPALGSFDVGDRVFIRARRGWLNVADYFRIVEIGVTVGDDGEQVVVTAVGFEAFE